MKHGQPHRKKKKLVSFHSTSSLDIVQHILESNVQRCWDYPIKLIQHWITLLKVI